MMMIILIFDTMKTIDEMIAVMTAYKEGKPIQAKSNIAFETEWNDCDGPKSLDWSWNWALFDYRVKPEPRYRPFADAEEVMVSIKEHGVWIKNGETHWSITEFNNHGFWLSGSSKCHSYDKWQHYTFADGTPFAKLEE